MPNTPTRVGPHALRNKVSGYSLAELNDKLGNLDFLEADVINYRRELIAAKAVARDEEATSLCAKPKSMAIGAKAKSAQQPPGTKSSSSSLGAKAKSLPQPPGTKSPISSLGAKAKSLSQPPGAKAKTLPKPTHKFPWGISEPPQPVSELKEDFPRSRSRSRRSRSRSSGRSFTTSPSYTIFRSEQASSPTFTPCSTPSRSPSSTKRVNSPSSHRTRSPTPTEEGDTCPTEADLSPKVLQLDRSASRNSRSSSYSTLLAPVSPPNTQLSTPPSPTVSVDGIDSPTRHTKSRSRSRSPLAVVKDMARISKFAKASSVASSDLNMSGVDLGGTQLPKSGLQPLSELDPSTSTPPRLAGLTNRGDLVRTTKDEPPQVPTSWHCSSQSAMLMIYEEADEEEFMRLVKQWADEEEFERLAKQQADEEEFERLATQQAGEEEFERLAKQQAEEEEFDRLAKQQADKEEFEKLAKQQADEEEFESLEKQWENEEEFERLVEQQADEEEFERLAKQQADEEEFDRLAKHQADEEEFERLAKQQADKEEFEKLAKQQADEEEFDRLAKQQADEEEFDRQADEEEFERSAIAFPDNFSVLDAAGVAASAHKLTGLPSGRLSSPSMPKEADQKKALAWVADFLKSAEELGKQGNFAKALREVTQCLDLLNLIHTTANPEMKNRLAKEIVPTILKTGEVFKARLLQATRATRAASVGA